MRALFLLPCRFWGGPEKQTLRLAARLRDEHAVEPVLAVMPFDDASVDENPLVLRAREAGFAVEPFAQKRRYDLVEGVRVLRGLVSRHRADVVCATGYKADVIAAWLGVVPTVAMLRGWTGEDAKVRLFEWLDRKTLRRHDAITVVSSALGEAAIREGVPRERVFRVPNAIDLAALPPPRSREELAVELGLDPARPIVGAVGRLSPEKGHRVLLEAFHALHQTLRDAQLVLVGDGPERPALVRRAGELGLSACTTFAGLRKDGQQIIGALDVMALPSFSEGMPNVVLEAFAYGTPVVATAVGALPDMLEDGRSGWLVPAGDPGTLAAALRQSLEDRPEALRRATEARTVLASRFTVERQAEAWLSASRAAVA